MSFRSKPLIVLKGHTAPLTSCSFNYNETLLATASRDASVRVYTISSSLLSDDIVPTNVINDCHQDWINASHWSNTGSFLVRSGFCVTTYLYYKVIYYLILLLYEILVLVNMCVAVCVYYQLDSKTTGSIGLNGLAT